MKTPHRRPARRVACLTVGFALTAALLVGTTPSLTAQDGAKAPAAVAKKEIRGDNPGEAAAFLAFMKGGGSGKAAPANAVMAADATAQPAAPDLTPKAIPAGALTKAIQRVRELRGEVATRRNVPIATLQADAARGQPARVGGIPVGPLAATEVNLPGGNTAFRTTARPLASATTLDPSGWKWEGPGNIGGRTRAVVVHPTQPEVIWLGGIAGGVWKTTDGGTTWTPLYDFMASMAVSCLAIDPTNPDVLYAGTGEGFYNGGAVRGAGIFVTKDGGSTWNQVPATAGTDFHYVNRIAIAKTGVGDKTVMLVATETGLFRSEDNGGTFEKVVGVATPRRTLDVKFDPKNPAKAVAASLGNDGGRAFYSENGGKSWTFAGGLPAGGRIELTHSLADPKVVYASVDQNQGAVYRSLDGGKTFTLRSTPGHLSGQGWYANCIWAGDPVDPNLVLVGGLDLHRSTNGGLAFARISDWTKAQKSPHADHHVIVSHAYYDGASNKTVFFGNDGGLYRATDATTAAGVTGWQELNNGLGITQFYGIAVNTANGHLAGGTQDNGTLFRTAGGSSETYAEIFGGDGGEMAADSANDYYYGEYVGLTLHRSKGGAEAQFIYQTIGDITPQGSKALFIAPFVLDQSAPKTLYAGGARLWRTLDATAAVPQFVPLSGAVQGDAISAIGVAPSDPKAVWIGFANGNAAPVFRSGAAGPAPNTWKAIAGLPKRYVSRIAVDPADSKVVHVTFTGYEKDNLYKTTNDGATWTAVGVGKLPEVPFYDITRHPDNDKLLYLATEVGLFVSDDAGANWSPTNQGPTNAPVRQLIWNKKTLHAGTYGRGIFTIDLTGAAPAPPGSLVPVAAPKAKPVLPDIKIDPPSNDPPQ